MTITVHSAIDAAASRAPQATASVVVPPPAMQLVEGAAGSTVHRTAVATAPTAVIAAAAHATARTTP